MRRHIDRPLYENQSIAARTRVSDEEAKKLGYESVEAMYRARAAKYLPVTADYQSRSAGFDVFRHASDAKFYESLGGMGNSSAMQIVQQIIRGLLAGAGR